MSLNLKPNPPRKPNKMPAQTSIIPEKGEHALIVGQNGSGKTAFACWLLLRVPEAPIIIYDTKDEPKFQKLPNSVVVSTMEEAAEYIDDVEINYIVVRPPLHMLDEPKPLNDMLLYHYHNFKGIPAYIDEAYTFQINGRAGKGLIALLTRGRSRGISTIISTQRPVRLDRFCITEAKKVYVFSLTDKADKKRLDDVIPNYSDLPKPVKHGFYFFSVGMDEPELFKPIKLDESLNTGYTDTIEANTEEPVKSSETSLHKRLWI